MLLGDEPTLFDAVEFDDAIATGDVLYDQQANTPLLPGRSQPAGRGQWPLVQPRSGRRWLKVSQPFPVAKRGGVFAGSEGLKAPRLPSDKASSRNAFSVVVWIFPPRADDKTNLAAASSSGGCGASRSRYLRLDQRSRAVLREKLYEQGRGVLASRITTPSTPRPTASMQVE